MTASVGTVLLDIASYAVGSSRFRRSLASHSSKRQCCQSSPSSSRGLHRCAHRMSPHGPPRLARMPSGLRGCRASAPAQRRCSSGRACCSSQCAAQCRARLPDCTRHTGSLRSSLTLRVANSCSCHAPRASSFFFDTCLPEKAWQQSGSATASPGSPLLGPQMLVSSIGPDNQGPSRLSQKK